MGLFGKERTGRFTAVAGSSNRYEWIIPAFSTFNKESLIDSEIAVYKKAKFHLHMCVGEKGNVGFFMHFKSPPIPKYSFFFMNSNGKMMPEHTANGYPQDSERCGYWSVCNRDDMLNFLGPSDTLRIVLIFDDDTLNTNYLADTMVLTWTIPHFHTQYLNPFSSTTFHVRGAEYTLRIDTKREGELIADYNPATTETYSFYVFYRKGIPVAHTLELLDANGQSYAKVEKREESDNALLIVSREIIDTHIGKGSGSSNTSVSSSKMQKTKSKSSNKSNESKTSSQLAQVSNDDTLYCRVTFYTGGNPLEQLNKSNEHSTINSNRDANSSNNSENKLKTVALGSKRQLYTLMND